MPFRQFLPLPNPRGSRLRPLVGAVCFVLGVLACSVPCRAQDGNAREAAPAGKPRFTEEVLRLQILLDRQLFGPGKLDGLPGEFTVKALQRYQGKHGLAPTDLAGHGIDLAAILPETYTEYTIRQEDLRFVGTVPAKPPEQSLRKYLPYASLLELICERFHCADSLLRLINSRPAPMGELAAGGTCEGGALNLDALKPGDVIKVPNVEPFRIEDLSPVPSLPEVPEFRTRIICIDTRERMLDVYGSECGPLLASFPITPGSGHLGTPPGSWKIVGISMMPTFRWDESVLEYGVRSEQFFQLPPGPNNPVGVLWTGLNRAGIGIHGTNHPDTIGRAASHGCMRTANWDAARLAKLITKGMLVKIEGPRPDPRPKKPEPVVIPKQKSPFWWLQGAPR